MKLYLLESDGYYKIGISHNVKSRVKSLQTGNPHKITVVRETNSHDRNTIMLVENLFHRVYREENVSGEWFKLDVYDVSLMIDFFDALSAGDGEKLISIAKEMKERT